MICITIAVGGCSVAVRKPVRRLDPYMMRAMERKQEEDYGARKKSWRRSKSNGDERGSSSAEGEFSWARERPDDHIYSVTIQLYGGRGPARGILNPIGSPPAIPRFANSVNDCPPASGDLSPVHRQTGVAANSALLYSICRDGATQTAIDIHSKATRPTGVASLHRERCRALHTHEQ
ncbi:hypothetical protein BD414DRAFT_479522 [Trametes punicea]|nr:hypothetical protein BD414DRAFT_479522 [Trametes punicea]